MSSRKSARRQFIKQGGLATMGFWVANSYAQTESKSPNEKLNIAMIGGGGKGGENLKNVSSENIVAICDCDQDRAKDALNKHPKAKRFDDYRKMLDEIHKEIDAVVVSTPDHHHAPAALRAMRLGKHAYVEKPLTHTIEEARLMRETAKQYKVATQMGNQGTSNDGVRQAVEIVQAGGIGPVREVHVWTNRPIWPQGATALAKHAGVRAALGDANAKAASVPSTMNWDVWLGPAKERPYDPCYAPFNWRGWWDFGTGALGDMACHTANMPFMALKLGAPTSVQAVSSELNAFSPPEWSTITFEFPARGDMPALKFVWYDGTIAGKRNVPPKELVHAQKMSDSGCLLVGDKGTLFSPNDYGAQFKMLPEDNFRDYKNPEQSIPRSIGHYAEWLRACKGGEPAMSNFDYAGPFTEFVLLGNVALQVNLAKSTKSQASVKIEWDGAAMKARNVPEANQFVSKEYRKGWEIRA